MGWKGNATTGRDKTILTTNWKTVWQWCELSQKHLHDRAVGVGEVWS